MPGEKAPESLRREQILAAAYAVAASKGLDGITVRAVAAKARLSHGLVLFHFRRRDELIAALLDRVLHDVVELRVPDDLSKEPRAAKRLRELLRLEMLRLSAEPQRFRLFLEFWALGVRDRAIRKKIATALDTYRGAFAALATELLGGASARGASATPDALAAVAVGIINGCAMQAMIATDGFDVEQYLAAAAVLGRVAPPVEASTRR